MTTRVTCASLELSEPMLTATITCANVDFSTLSLWPLCVVPTSPHQHHWYKCVWTDYWNLNSTHLFFCCCLLNSAVLSVYFCVCVFVFFVFSLSLFLFVVLLSVSMSGNWPKWSTMSGNTKRTLQHFPGVIMKLYLSRLSKTLARLVTQCGKAFPWAFAERVRSFVVIQ